MIWEFIYWLTRRMNLEEERRESAQCEDDKAESWFFTKIYFLPNFGSWLVGFGSFGLHFLTELDTSLLDCYNYSICTLIGAWTYIYFITWFTLYRCNHFISHHNIYTSWKLYLVRVIFELFFGRNRTRFWLVLMNLGSVPLTLIREFLGPSPSVLSGKIQKYSLWQQSEH